MNAKGNLAQTTATGLSTSALRNKVEMPAATSDPGNAGDYAVNGDQLAIYVAGTGWVFTTVFQQ